MLSTELTDLKAYMAENPGAVIEDVARGARAVLNSEQHPAFDVIARMWAREQAR